MLRTIRRLTSPSLVISTFALLLAVGGTSYAALTLPHNSVGTKQLKNQAVTNAKLANNAVGTAKIKNGAVTASKLNLAGVTVAGTARWALVSASGAILAQSGGISVTGHATGRTGLRFPAGVNTQNAAIVAQVTAFGFAGTDAGLYFTKVGPCPTTTDCASVNATASTDVVIDTFAPTSAFASAGTYVTLTQ